MAETARLCLRLWLPATAALLFAAGQAIALPAPGLVCTPKQAKQAALQIAAVAAPAVSHGDDAGLPAPVADLIASGEADLRAGRLPAALASLREATERAQASGDQQAIAAATGSLGVALQAAGEAAPARAALEQSLDAAQAADDPALQATTLVNLGNLLAADGGTADQGAGALDAYDRAVALALAADRPALAGRASLNRARLLARSGAGTDASQALGRALDLLAQAPGGAERAAELVNAGLLARDLADPAGATDPDLLLLAHGLFSEAAERARTHEDTRTESYALGHLGGLYLDQGRADEALTLSRRALFLAQSADAPESLYRWQWQVGRLLTRQGELDAAIQAYEGAVETLQSIRRDLPAFDPTTGRSLFRETVGPVFLELADLLLQRAGHGDGIAQPDLVAARGVVEQLKTAELEDYFQDDCVALLQARARPIDEIGARSAALYPIILPDRLELLVSVQDGLLRATVPVSSEELGRTARELRTALVGFTDPLPAARRLHDWLIAPIADRLAERDIDTLVFVPDGALRLIPLSVLHDGRDYLVRRYAIATAPGLSLLDPQPLAGTELRPLLGGLTEEVQGFPPLPSVAQELDEIQDLYGGTVLANAAFSEERLAAELEATPYTVVHIASHAQFTSDPDDSFLLTYDGRLTMDELENLIKLSRFREEPIELIALSACETAAGDDRAALGLAGIAVKAGARSAMATLWLVDDVAAAQLSAAFYRNLGEPGISRARALQEAQVALLDQYDHPFFWAPFLLIGNWL